VFHVVKKHIKKTAPRDGLFIHHEMSELHFVANTVRNIINIFLVSTLDRITC
jgi:hypothetical protein